MSKFHIRIKINPGGHGARLDKLGEISSQIEAFLRNLAQDTSIKVKKGDFVAVNFANGSACYDVELVSAVRGRQVQRYNTNLMKVIDFNPEDPKLLKGIRPQTIYQFAKIADPIESDEEVGIGLFENGGRKPKQWRYLSKATAKEIIKALAPVEYDGGIQAVIHSLFLEAERPYFKARELSTGELVTCFYKSEIHYPQIMDTLKRQQSIVHITGTAKASRLDRQVTEIAVDKIVPAKTITKEELYRFFGCAPNLTGNLSTGEFIARIRHHGEA